MSDYGSCLADAWPIDFEKDPDSVEDFPINWAGHLNGDTIATTAWSSLDGLTVVSDSNTDTVTDVLVSGGSECTTYRLRNRITTAGGRTYDKTIYVRIREQ
jgi:hypothetical protein